MKTTQTLVSLSLSALVSLSALGQAPDSPDEQSGPRPLHPRVKMPGGDKVREKFLENLPPEIRERFMAAREKALQDPAIQTLRQTAESANKEFMEAMREKMLQIDPGLAEVIKKNVGQHQMREKVGERQALSNLTETERQKFLAARDIAKNDPSVKAAEEKKKSAQTPEERRAAQEEFRKAMEAALLKADPSIAPILQKIKPPQPPFHGGSPGEKPTNA